MQTLVLEPDLMPKVEIGLDGKPKMKLKDAFLARPPNNQVLQIKSIFNKRPATIYFPYPHFLKLHRTFDQERLVRCT